MSIPRESPISPTSASWGAPPPVPLHVSDEQSATRPPLFEHPTLELPAEPELNLADFINIDDDPMVDVKSGEDGGAVRSSPVPSSNLLPIPPHPPTSVSPRLPSPYPPSPPVLPWPITRDPSALTCTHLPRLDAHITRSA
ncbi:hypothetical protein BDZ89DRAFT_1254842 [Hymenopellis radicata]|nr:hypothetical protein BDZ89DRAFT_1254842 [Hymenopellis radicata]